MPTEIPTSIIRSLPGMNIPGSYMKNFMRNYFSGSFKEMVSFFAKEDNMSLSDFDELMEDVKRDLENENSESDE
jgi:BlaI family transcriptional regulator, penicillinase repressor